MTADNGQKPSNDSRRYHRFPAAWTVEIKASNWTEALQLVTGEISRGGLFIRCPEPIDPGTRLEIMIQLPDYTRLSAEGEVAHCIGPERAEAEGVAAGIGIRFDEKHSIDLNLLEGIAASNAAGEGRQLLDDSYISLPAILFGLESDLQMITTAYQRVRAPVPQKVVDAGRGAEGALGLRTALAALKKSEDPDEPIFGIDFGTSYSNIALVRGHEVVMFRGDDGRDKIPSMVTYMESGSPLVGWAAREQLALSPAATIVSPKRMIGRSFDEPRLDAFLNATPVHFIRGPNEQIVAEVFGQPVAMPQVCAALFRHLMEIAEEGCGVPVKRAVLSAPVGLQSERAAIKRAAEIAGIEVVEILDEPVAAALAYGLSVSDDQTIAVYDFGGGTFDFSLLRVRGGMGVEVIGTAGDAWLGGDDFDLALANHAADVFWRQNKIDLRTRAAEWQRLLFEAEAVKSRLSMERKVSLVTTEVAMTAEGSMNLEMAVDREMLHHLCHEHVERSIEVMEGCLDIVGIRPDQIDHIVLTGGTTRSPHVRGRLQRFFDREVSLKLDPDLAVVTGNAIYARFAAAGAKPQV